METNRKYHVVLDHFELNLGEIVQHKPLKTPKKK